VISLSSATIRKSTIAIIYFFQRCATNTQGNIMLEIFRSGGPVMYPLLACSIIVFTVIIERIFFWIKLDINR
jgi:hypothetical protein